MVHATLKLSSIYLSKSLNNKQNKKYVVLKIELVPTIDAHQSTEADPTEIALSNGAKLRIRVLVVPSSCSRVRRGWARHACLAANNVREHKQIFVFCVHCTNTRTSALLQIVIGDLLNMSMCSSLIVNEHFGSEPH